MRIRATEPEPRSEIITASEESRVRGRVYDVPHRPIVTQRHEMQSGRIPRVPRAQRRRGFVWE